MRQDEKPLLLQTSHDGCGHHVWLEHPVDGRDGAHLDTFGHPGTDRLRAEQGHAQSAFAIGDRQPFGEAHGGMLGRRIGRRPDLAQQTGRRRRLQQIAPTSLKHKRHQRPRHVHVGKHVDSPAGLPQLVADLCIPRHE